MDGITPEDSDDHESSEDVSHFREIRPGNTYRCPDDSKFGIGCRIRHHDACPLSDPRPALGTQVIMDI